MNNFKYLWILLITCCYFKVSPSQIQTFHPTAKLSRVKQIVSYLIYQAGATGMQAAEYIGSCDEGIIYHNRHKIAGLIEPGRGQDRRLKCDIDRISKLIDLNNF